MNAFDAGSEIVSSRMSPQSSEPSIGSVFQRIRLVIINSHPIQYLLPLYRVLSHSEVIDLHVVFLSDLGLRASYDPGFDQVFAFDSLLAEGFSHEFLRRGVTRPPAALRGPWLKLTRRLRALRPDIILVHGYVSPASWIGAAVAKMGGDTYMIRCDSNLSAAFGAHFPKRVIKEVIVGGFVRRAGACLAGGCSNRDFYRHHAVKEERIVLAPFSVDTELFSVASEVGQSRRVSRLASIGLDPNLPVVLFAGKLVPWKRAQDVVLGCALLDVPVNVVVVGDGPQRDVLHHLLKKYPRARRIGFVNQREIGEWYGIADVVVVPSEREPWGLVVNEALAAGSIPVLSNEVGCAGEFVSQGAALTYACGDVQSLARVLSRVLEDERLRDHMKTNGAAASEARNLDATARGYERAAQVAYFSNQDSGLGALRESPPLTGRSSPWS